MSQRGEGTAKRRSGGPPASGSPTTGAAGGRGHLRVVTDIVCGRCKAPLDWSQRQRAHFVLLIEGLAVPVQSRHYVCDGCADVYDAECLSGRARLERNARAFPH